MDSLFFTFYRTLGWPLLRGAFQLLAIFNPKVRAGLKMRMKRQDGLAPWFVEPKGARPIWIHCASGEFEYAKPVITLLKQRHPEQKVLVTYFSPTYANAIATFPGVDLSCPLPWDQPKDLREFIYWHKPLALLVSRTDTWPEMLRQAKRAGLPTLLFSATLQARSGRAKGLGKWLSKNAFTYLDQIFCVSHEDLEVFKKLGFANRTEVAGDTRYDQVLARLENPKPLREEIFQGLNRENCFVAGSTWPEDESVLIEAATKLKDSQLRFILVPHEPTDDHLTALEKEISRKGLRSIRYSTAQSWNQNEILLVDKIGILAELYQKGRFAFVGGSFRKTVHSVMEPLAAGCLTWVGPKHTNNREAVLFQSISVGENLKAVMVCENADSLARTLKEANQSDLDFSSVIRAEIEKRTGQSRRVAEWIEQHVLSTARSRLHA